MATPPSAAAAEMWDGRAYGPGARDGLCALRDGRGSSVSGPPRRPSAMPHATACAPRVTVEGVQYRVHPHARLLCHRVRCAHSVFGRVNSPHQDHP
eukprot:6201763-Pleurochrysis_carterae.AAC.2